MNTNHACQRELRRQNADLSIRTSNTRLQTERDGLRQAHPRRTFWTASFNDGRSFLHVPTRHSCGHRNTHESGNSAYRSRHDKGSHSITFHKSTLCLAEYFVFDVSAEPVRRYQINLSPYGLPKIPLNSCQLEKTYNGSGLKLDEQIDIAILSRAACNVRAEKREPPYIRLILALLQRLKKPGLDLFFIHAHSIYMQLLRVKLNRGNKTRSADRRTQNRGLRQLWPPAAVRAEAFVSLR